MNSEIIKFDKGKLTKQFVFSAIFVVAGILFIFFPFWFIRSDNPYVIKFTGYLLIFIFGFLALFFGRKVFDTKPGMVIDDEGILDNSSGLNIGKVFWKDMTGIREKIMNGHPFMLIEVKNPDDYIGREVNPLKKRIMDLNYRMYQTPINITSKGLKIEFEELREIITGNFTKFRT